MQAPDAPSAKDAPITGFCRRGITTLCAGRAPADALAIIERSCSLAGGAHRLAYCLALESLTRSEAPENARIVRTLFVEVERILARLWTLGQTARAAEEYTPFQEALEQRELLLSALEETTGARMFWGVALPGGARADLTLTPLREALEHFAPTVETWRVATSPDGPLGRVTTRIGQISRRRAEELGLHGLAACGAGLTLPTDLRQSAPYDGYQDVAIEWPDSSKGQTSETNQASGASKTTNNHNAANGGAKDTTGNGANGSASSSSGSGSNGTVGKRGDVASRMRCAAADIGQSVSIAQACLDALGDEPEWENTSLQLRSGAGEATVEGPHGPVTIALTLGESGAIADLRLTTPCAATLNALPALLTDRPLAEAPLILASLDLCLECVDL